MLSCRRIVLYGLFLSLLWKRLDNTDALLLGVPVPVPRPSSSPLMGRLRSTRPSSSFSSFSFLSQTKENNDDGDESSNSFKGTSPSKGFREKVKSRISPLFQKRKTDTDKKDRLVVGEVADETNNNNNIKQQHPKKWQQRQIQYTKGLKKRVVSGFWKRQVWKIQFFIRSRITRRYTIYVLECEQDKWYIGSTLDRKKRYRSHLYSKNGGSAWTKVYRPLRVYEEYRRVPSRYYLGHEAQVTAEYMLDKGIQNVRGAMFTQSREYTLQDLDALVGFLGHYNELDYRDLRTQLRKDLLVRPPPPQQPSSLSFPSRTAIQEGNRKSFLPDLDNPNKTSYYDGDENSNNKSTRTIRRGTMPQQQQRRRINNSIPPLPPPPPPRPPPRRRNVISDNSNSSRDRNGPSDTSRLKPVQRVGSSSKQPEFFDFSSVDACFNCGKSGHYSANCPETIQTVCFNCGGTGHFKADCPNLPRCFLCGEIGHVRADCKSQKW